MKNFNIIHILGALFLSIIFLLGIHSTFAGVGANLTLEPNTASYDNLIGATNAQWKFTATTTADIVSGDVVQFIFPNPNDAPPFDISGVTLTATSGVRLYKTMLGQPLSNMLQNSSFETATGTAPYMEYWSQNITGSSTIATSSTAYNGSVSAQITSTSSANGAALLYQGATTATGTQYTASYYARGAAGSEIARIMLQGNATCGGNSQYYNFASSTWECVVVGGTTFNSVSPYVASSTLTTGFQRFTQTFTTPSDSSSTAIVFVGGGDVVYDNEVVIYDAVQLETGGSAAAFNLGGVGNPEEGVMVGGQNIAYGYATSTIPSGTTFSVTLGGVTNSTGQIDQMSDLTWTVKAGTPVVAEEPGGALTEKFNQTSTESLVRAGGALVSDSGSSITPTSYATGTAASFTFTVTATSSIPSGGKIVINFPSEYSLSSVTVGAQDINSSSTPAQIASSAFTTQTGAGMNRVVLTTSNAATAAGDNFTVTIGGLTNPSTVGVYRPFFVFTTLANDGLLDGSYFGFEQSDYTDGPPPVDTVHIGGDNTLNVIVHKQSGTTTVALSGDELNQVKVGVGCPDKQFFVGERWLNASSAATYQNILDCNYFVGSFPPDQTSATFYDSFLPPAMKAVQVVGGQIATTTIVYGVPDATTTLTITGGVSGENAFVHGFSEDFEAFSDVFTDTTYSTTGFNGSGIGYARLKVKSGQTWNFTVMSGGLGSEGNFTSGDAIYWPPQIPAAYIDSAGDYALGSFAYIMANNTLDISLLKSGTTDPVQDACIGVKRSGGGFFMPPQDVICQPNSGNDYQFKVPVGAITVEVMRHGFGAPEEYPIGITSSSTSKTIYVSVPTSYISVAVQDSSGNAINGAPVFAHGSNGWADSMTGTAGTTTIYVASGTYTVEGFAPAFGPMVSQSVIVTDSSNPSVTFTVDTGALKTVSGMVTQGGVAVAGLKIGAHGISGTTGGNGAETDNNGSYVLYLQPGVYEVGGWSPDTGGLAPQNVNVSSSNATGVNWTLGGQGTLQFNIQNAANVSPLFAGAFDQTTGRGNGTDVWTTSGTTKTAKVTLPAGTYEVHVGSPLLGEITPANETVTITAGNTATKTYSATSSVTLVTLSGSVTYDGNNIANANVWASRVGGPGFFSTQTDSSGNYSLKVPDGYTYNVGVKIMGYVANEGDVEKAVSGNTAQNFTLAQADATIAGTIYNASDVAIANAWVSAVKTVSGNEVWLGMPTDAAGAYSLGVDSGSTWTVYAEGPCYDLSSGLSAAAGSSGKNITLSAISGCTIPVPQLHGITPATGGQVSKDDITLDIPANALGTGQSTVSVSISDASLVVSTANATPLAGSVQSITATGDGQSITSLNSGVSLTIAYDENNLPVGFDEADLQLGYFDTNTGQWEPVAATVDTTNDQISATINHFTDYGPILPGVPSAPANLAATAASASGINLTWDAVPTATSYVLYRSSTDSDFTTAIASGISTNSYSDTGLSASTKYYYEVAGTNSNGEGPNSSSANATTQTASVTPQGGGRYFSVAPLTQDTTIDTTDDAEIAETQESTVEETSDDLSSPDEVKTVPTVTILFDLELGMTNTSVRDLQELLASYPEIYPEGLVTGYYGPLTQKAIERFQVKYGIVTSGTPKTTGFGRLGPKTRAKLNETFGQTKGVAVAKSVAAPQAAVHGAFFVTGLKYGMSDEKIKLLQEFLNTDPDTQVADSDAGSSGNETNYFGELTLRAVERFQAKHGIAVKGDPGYGYVGPKTRAKLNALYGDS